MRGMTQTQLRSSKLVGRTIGFPPVLELAKPREPNDHQYPFHDCLHRPQQRGLGQEE